MKKENWLDIKSGNMQAYSETYIFYYKKLYNYGRKFTDDIALIESAIDEVFIIVWMQRDRFSNIRSPHSYIFTSFRHNIFNKLKNQRSTYSIDSAEDVATDFSIDALIISREVEAERQLDLERALKQLTSRQREAIFLRFYEGLSYEEVAGVMNISVKATYKIMARALKDLRNILGISTLSILSLLVRPN